MVTGCTLDCAFVLPTGERIETKGRSANPYQRYNNL